MARPEERPGGVDVTGEDDGAATPPSSLDEGPGQLVALGRTSVILPDSSRAGLHEGLSAIPVTDAPPITTVIAWPPHSRSRALALLVRVASTL